MSVLVLLTDLCEGTGGIRTFNRAFVRALKDIAVRHEWRMKLLVLNDAGHQCLDSRYIDDGTQVHSFSGSKAYFAAAALRAAPRASRIVLGHVHFAPLAIGFRTMNPRAEMFLIAHGVEIWKRLLGLERLGLTSVSRIFSVSTYTRDRAITANRLDTRRFDLLPNTIDPFHDHDSAIKSRLELGLPRGRMILTVSRLSAAERYKNIDVAIDALGEVLNRVPDAFYVVVGDGSDRERLESIARARGVERRVIFTGQVPDALLPSYYQACDVFLLPSTREGFGIVLLEAMRHEKPCIGVWAGGIPEVIVDGKTGFLAEPGNPDALASLIVRLLQDQELARLLGRRGHQRFQDKFSFPHFLEHVDRLLSNDRARRSSPADPDQFRDGNARQNGR